MIRTLFAALLIAMLGSTVLAQSTATPVVPGTLTQAGCGPGQTTCWQPTTPLTPIPILLTSFTSTGTGSLSASTTTSNTALPANGSLVSVTNTGAVTAYVNLGVGSGLVATTNNYAIPPGQVAYLNVGNATYIAAITTSSTASLTLASGNLTSSIASSGSTNATIVGPLGRQADAASVSQAWSTEDVALANSIITNTGGAIPAGANLIGKVGIDQTTPGTTNAVASQWSTNNALATPHLCGSHVYKHITTATDTQIVAVSGSTTIYVCDVAFSAAAAQNFYLEKSTSSTCGTLTQIDMLWTLVANESKGFTNPYYQGLNTGASASLCANTSAAAGIDIAVSYDQY